MKFELTGISGVILVKCDVFKDARGFFMETHHQEKYKQGGIPEVFVQDNVSFSVQNVLRGLHSQMRNPQGKLITALQGRILDVAVDIRVGSPTFKKWVGVELSDENRYQLYVPPGFAHGFWVLSPTALVSYKCTQLYDAADETGVLWNDPEVGIEWPGTDPILTEKDKISKRVSELLTVLPRYKAHHGM